MSVSSTTNKTNIEFLNHLKKRIHECDVARADAALADDNIAEAEMIFRLRELRIVQRDFLRISAVVRQQRKKRGSNGPAVVQVTKAALANLAKEGEVETKPDDSEAE